MTAATPLSGLGRAEALAVAVIRTCMGLGLIAMVVVNVANAVGRYSGWAAFVGADELLVYGMIWIVMLGAILAARERDHLSIDLFPQSLSRRSAARLGLAIDVVTMGLSAFVAWHSLGFIERVAKIGQTSMALGIPMTVPHLAIFVGFAGIAAVTAVLIVFDLKRMVSSEGGRA